jgi:acetoacetyl-CoA synthetase
MAWFYRNVKQDLWVANGSGGTDCCTGFVGGVPTLPVRAGEIQAPSLGVSVKAFNERGESVIDEVGELVITEPMPSMPLRFWNDDGDRRYRETYFEDFPGVWRHGDFFKINARGACFVLGRSDATLNRHGVRIGTAEIYRALMQVPGVEDALIVNLDLPDGGFFMPLFVQLDPGAVLDDALAAKIREQLPRQDLCGSLDTAHADRQEDGSAGPPDPDGRARRQGGESRRDGEPGGAGLFHRLRGPPVRLRPACEVM